jgi:hypothetical protein
MDWVRLRAGTILRESTLLDDCCTLVCEAHRLQLGIPLRL